MENDNSDFGAGCLFVCSVFALGAFCIMGGYVTHQRGLTALGMIIIITFIIFIKWNK